MSKYVILFYLLATSPLYSEDVFLLSKTLEFSKNSQFTDLKMIHAQEKGITLFKVIEKVKNILKIEVIQKNGLPANEILYISEKWFNRGTKKTEDPSFINLKLDPNQALQNINSPLKLPCPGFDETTSAIFNSPPTICDKALLETPSSKEAHLQCFEFLQNKIKNKMSEKNRSKRAYQAISALYELKEHEQKFLAYLLTMYGEARGTKPVKEQMAGVMKVIQNRTEYAKEKGFLDANELDVVLQNNQFSMYNVQDNNWEVALNANFEEMSDAVDVYMEKDSFQIKINQKKQTKKTDSVYHYISKMLYLSEDRPLWSLPSNHVNLAVNGSVLNNSNGHVFFSNVPWTFEPTNKYKKYAEKEEKNR